MRSAQGGGAPSQSSVAAPPPDEEEKWGPLRNQPRLLLEERGLLLRGYRRCSGFSLFLQEMISSFLQITRETRDHWR